MPIVTPNTSLEQNGYAVISSGLQETALGEIRRAVDSLLAVDAARGGARNALDVPTLRAVTGTALREVVSSHFKNGAFAVRGLVFDKTPLSNWKVPWHQDVTISVTEYRECRGWGPWSRKGGAWHVRPPAQVLESMLTARLHLDDCGLANGPVRVIPGSHLAGRLSDTQVMEVSRSREPVDCLVPEGGVLLMRPLLLHASAPAAIPGHRRVLHVEFSDLVLPHGFSWAEALQP